MRSRRCRAGQALNEALTLYGIDPHPTMTDRWSAAGRTIPRSGSLEPGGDEPTESELRYGAKGLAVEGGRVLLSLERRVDGSTFWTLPGGGIQGDETFVEGLRRELKEELDCAARIGDPLTVCSYRHLSLPGTVTVYTIYGCDLLGSPAPNPGDDVLTASWFSPRDLPETTLPPIARAIEELFGFRHVQNPPE